MEKEAKGSTFKMKAGKEGPMKKNFPSAFKQTTDNEKYFYKERKSQLEEEKLKTLKGQARVDAFSKRHNVEYKRGVNTAGTVEQGRGQTMFVDADGNSIEMNERNYLSNLEKGKYE